MSAIASQAQGVIRQGIAQAADQCGLRLQEAAQVATRAAATLDAQARTLAGTQRGIAWKAGLALLVGAVLAAGGSALVAWKSLRDLERAGFGEDILQATRSGAITRCGEALCVKVGVEPHRAGTRGEFLLVEP